jgi:hypothetical protein
LNSEESASEPSPIPLIPLQEIIHKRIRQKKGEIHRSNNIAYTNIIWAEMDRNIAVGLG